jgi:protein phosphatase
MTLNTAGRTVVGKQSEENEDAIQCEELPQDAALVVVADGMGSHAGGATASETAVDAFTGHVTAGEWDEDPMATIEAAVETAHHAISDKADDNPELADMGCTLVGGVVTSEDVSLVNVGDSRAYDLTTEATQLTTDQTLANEMLEAGELEPEEAEDHQMAHVLDQSLGYSDDIDPELLQEPIDGTLLLCSDGLTDELPDNRLATVGRQDSLSDACDQLIEEANAAGGHDNISVVLARPDA